MSSPDIYHVLANKNDNNAYCLINANKASEQDKAAGFLLGRTYLVLKGKDQTKNYTTDPDKVFAEISNFFDQIPVQMRNAPNDPTLAETARTKVTSTIDAYMRDPSLFNTTCRASLQTWDWAMGWQPLEESARKIDAKMSQLGALAVVITGNQLATAEASPATFNAAASALLRRTPATPKTPAQPPAPTPAPAQVHVSPRVQSRVSTYTTNRHVRSSAQIQPPQTQAPRLTQSTLSEKIDALNILYFNSQINTQWRDELETVYSEIWTHRNFAGLVRTITLEKMQNLVVIFKLAGCDGQSNWLASKLELLAKK